MLPEAALDARLGVGFSSHGGGLNAVVRGKGEIPRIVDGLVAFPPEHDGLLAVVLAARGAAAEAREGALVAVHEREQVRRAEDVEGLALRIDQDVREQLHSLGEAGRIRERVGRPIVFGHLTRSEHRSFEARRRLGRWPHAPHLLLDGGVAALESLVLEDLQHALRGDVRVAREQLAHATLVGVDLAGTRRAHGRSGQRGVPVVALATVGPKDLLDRVPTDPQRPRDGAPAHPLGRQHDDLVDQLLARAPVRRHGTPALSVTEVIVFIRPPSTPWRLLRSGPTMSAAGPNAASGIPAKQA